MANSGVTVRIVSNRLPQMPAAIKAICVAEVQKAAYRIEADAKSKVAVKTGTLRRSIHSVFENGGLRALIGPSVLYSRFVEFGTRRMGARPYMRPAAERNLPQFAAAIKSALGGLK